MPNPMVRPSDTRTLFPDREKAERLQKLNQREDPDWTYEVEPVGRRFAVRILDEAGRPVGYL